MAKYPPYVNAYGKISDVFEGIKSASVPPKFTYDFLSTVLGLTSSSYRAMIPLLKKLDFLDQGSVPTEHYKKFRDDFDSACNFYLGNIKTEKYRQLAKKYLKEVALADNELKDREVRFLVLCKQAWGRAAFD